MKQYISCALVLISLVVWTNAERPYIHDKLVRLEPFTGDHIHYLQALENHGLLDFWTEIVAPNNSVDVHIRANDFDQYISQFKQFSLPFEVLVDDLQEVIDHEQEELNQDRSMRQAQSRLLGDTRANILGTYVSYSEMVAFLQETAQKNPTNIKVVDLGRTSQGRTMNAISIQFNPSSTRNVWIDCGIHAREWITPATCIWIADKLIEDYNKNDPVVRRLLDGWTVYVAPSLNPDGYEYSRTSGNRLWRKSRNANSGSSCIGVDLNRNYPWKWMTGGASSSPCSDTFGGSSAGSEIETKNVVNFLQARAGTWDMYMSFHSYGQWWFTPYGYTTSLPADYRKQLELAQKGAAAIQKVNNRKYTVGSVAQLLYIASGSTVDWAYDSLKIRHSYTIELPPTQAESSTGFVLPVQLAPGVCNETYIGMKEFMAGVKTDVDSMSG